MSLRNSQQPLASRRPCAAVAQLPCATRYAPANQKNDFALHSSSAAIPDPTSANKSAGSLLFTIG